MEIVLLIFGLIGVAFLAMRYGYDSRESIFSEEHGKANLGVTWHGAPHEAHQPIAPPRTHPLRHHLAGVLYRLADWLYPGVNEVVPA